MTWMKNSYTAGLSGLLLLASLVLHYSGLSHAKTPLLLATTLIAGYPIALKAIQSLRMRVFSIELLVTIAVVGALIIGEYVESAAVTFLFVFGAYLETRTLEKTRSALKGLIDMAPQEATVVRPDGLITVPVEDLLVGDTIRIRSGEKVAVDGRIVSGQALIVEAAITGESVPANKTIDDHVYSGTLLDNGYIDVLAERVGDDTTFAKIIELVEIAQESKTKTQKFLEKFANIYTPTIVVLSVLVYLVTRNIELALTFLVIACPGALVISAPVSIVAGIGNGARHGILIKGGEIMERLAKIDTVLFDKTGTLTRGRPEVTDIKTWGTDENALLRLVAEAEIISEHHLGQTIVAEAHKRKLELVNPPSYAEVIKGNGMRAQVAGHQLVIGNRKLMHSDSISLNQDALDYAVTREKAGNTAIFAAVDGVLAGIISIADQIKPEAAQAIASLRAAGIKQIYMLTGDNQHTAKLVGDTLGLDAVYAELLPEDKVAWVQKLQAQGHHVAMAGDGINDAPALASADIGLAMGHAGTDISMETADIVLMADRLDQFAHAYSLAKSTVRNMQQNTFFAVGTVVLLLAGVLLGKVFLASGMLIHEISVLLVIVNAVRLIRYQAPRPATPIVVAAPPSPLLNT